MMLTCGVQSYSGGAVSNPIPTEPDPGPGYFPPATTGWAGDRWMVAVGDFPANHIRGPLWDARIESMPERFREIGGNELEVTVPNTRQNQRLLGASVPGWQDQAGHPLFSANEAIGRELILGRTDNGKARRRFVVRDAWESSETTLALRGRGIIGGLTSDRVIGAPTRLNLLGDRLGSFESGDLTGWRFVNPLGTGDAGVVSGGVDGTYKAWITGDPTNGTTYLEATCRASQPPRRWGPQKIGATAYVQLPDYGIDIDDAGLVAMWIFDAATGAIRYPRDGGPTNLGAGIVEGGMKRGSFTQDPVEAFGILPSPPFTVDIKVRLYPTDLTERTYYDGVQVIRNENSSTINEVDTTRHIRKLFDTAQKGTGKSDWGVRVSYGEPSGVVKVGTWFHSDGQSLPDAIEGVCAEGVEVWDYPSGKREVRAAHRRGAVRTDVQVNRWDVLGKAKWQIDPGAQRTAVRATSAAGSLWGGSDVGAVDTSQAWGQVIDVIVSGPVGMTPTQLQAWANSQLGTYKLIQTSGTWLLPYALGSRIAVGDTIRDATATGAAGHCDWVRIHAKDPDPDDRWIAVDWGTDPELGGR